MSDTYVNVSNAIRPEEAGNKNYQEILKKIESDKVCPFCANNLLNYHKHPILREGERWIVTTNMYPYKGSKHHFLFIHKEHINTFDMPVESFMELQQHVNWVVKENNIPGGTFMMRFGELTASTVTHLHAHLVTPDSEPVITRIC